jgi:hypothetical protein
LKRVKCDHQLVEIVRTLDAVGGPADATSCREEETYYDRNDCDDDKEFDKGESAAC